MLKEAVLERQDTEFNRDIVFVGALKRKMQPKKCKAFRRRAMCRLFVSSVLKEVVLEQQDLEINRNVVETKFRRSLKAQNAAEKILNVQIAMQYIDGLLNLCANGDSP